jgi:biotin operon repressor
MDKDLRKIVKALEAQGFEVETTSKGHIVVTRDGVLIATASDWRSIRNGLAPLRRAGFRWPPRR